MVHRLIYISYKTNSPRTTSVKLFLCVLLIYMYLVSKSKTNHLYITESELTKTSGHLYVNTIIILNESHTVDVENMTVFLISLCLRSDSFP